MRAGVMLRMRRLHDVCLNETEDGIRFLLDFIYLFIFFVGGG